MDKYDEIKFAAPGLKSIWWLARSDNYLLTLT